MTFLERIRRGLVIFDGAMGTMMQKHIKMEELPEMLNFTIRTQSLRLTARI